LADHNLALLAERSFERHGDYDSLWFEGRAYRSGELLERAQRVGAGLVERGVRPGDRVVVFGANRPEVSLVYNAIWRAGAVATPVIFLLPPPELAAVIAGSEASLVVASPEFADDLRASAPVDVISTDDLPEAEPAPIVPREDDDIAVLLFTGGTTGRAKGVMLSHANLWHAGKSGHDVGYVPGIRRSLVTVPLSHSYGMLITVVGLQAAEPPVAVLMRWFEPTAFLELVQEHGVQITAVVPSMLQLLLAQPLEDYDLSSLRYVVSGAAPLPREVIDEIARRLPNVVIREGYGLTETSALATSNPPEAVRLGTVGRATPGTDIRIVDERDAPLPAGEVGEICCRSPFVMRGYWREPELTAEAMRGGWFHTGDLGSVDEDGYVTIVDRKKDLIIRGGFNVYPRDVEEAMLEHPEVEAAGVVGRPDAAHGEEVVAFVSLRSGSATSADDLVAFAKERVGGYKYPREVRVVPAIPLTAVGKVDRKALRALMEEP
jgi:long-chain acyl-CoA synthetase